MNPAKFVLIVSGLICAALIGFAVFLTVRGDTPQTRSIPMNPAYEQRLKDKGWVRGATSPLVTVIEYADFQCPGCAALNPVMEEAFRQTQDYVQFTFRQYPLQGHNKGKMSAQATEAAGRQGKFWDMYNVIFQNQNSWVNDTPTAYKSTLVEYAKSLGLSTDQFKNDMNDQSINLPIDSDSALGNEIPIKGTPTVLINGVVLENIPQSAADLVKIIEAAKASPTA